MSPDNVSGVASAAVSSQPREGPRARSAAASTEAAAAAVARPAAVSVPKVELKTPEKPALQVDVAEKQRNLEEAIQRLNDQMRSNNRDLAFAIDRKIDRTIITVRSAQSGEVVRQIPDEAVLRVAHSIEDIKGMLLNTMA